MINLLPVDLLSKYNKHLSLIVDSYRRMSTNRDINYRNQQLEKCEKWLEEMTVILENYMEE